MIQFNEAETSNGCRTFFAVENGKKVGSGTLKLSGTLVEIVLEAAEKKPHTDFLFRGLINVFSGLTGLCGALSVKTAAVLGGETYLKNFGFKKMANGSFSAKAEEIMLQGECSK